MARDAGVRLVPLWSADEGGVDLVVERDSDDDEQMTDAQSPVLLVEDDEDLRRIVAVQLRGQGVDGAGGALGRGGGVVARRRAPDPASSCST